MTDLYAILAAIGVAILGAIGLYFKGGQSQRRKDKIKGQDAKIKQLKTKDAVDELSDDDVTAGLTGWVRPDDK